MVPLSITLIGSLLGFQGQIHQNTTNYSYIVDVSVSVRQRPNCSLNPHLSFIQIDWLLNRLCWAGVDALFVFVGLRGKSTAQRLGRTRVGLLVERRVHDVRLLLERHHAQSPLLGTTQRRRHPISRPRYVVHLQPLAWAPLSDLHTLTGSRLAVCVSVQRLNVCIFLQCSDVVSWVTRRTSSL